MVNTEVPNMDSPFDKLTFLNDMPYTLCLQQEVLFLNSGNMELLVDMVTIYVSNDGDSWNDSMAYLNNDLTTDQNSRQSNLTHKKNKELLKCGFIVTGRPKKIWCLKLPKATIGPDNLNNKWYQVGNDMMVTKYEELSKYRRNVQLALNFGIKKNCTTIPQLDENAIVVPIADKAMTGNTDCFHEDNRDNRTHGVFCCAKDLCGMGELLY